MDGPRRRELLTALAGTLVPGLGWAGELSGVRRHFLFGSPVTLAAPRASAALLDALLQQLQRMHVEWNAWKPGELGRLNAALRAGRSAAASAPLRAMIALSVRLERASGGFFNAGIGGAVGAWGFHDDVMRDGPRPDAHTLARWQAAAPSLAQLEVRGAQVASRNPLLQLDFGAIAKGVAIDRTLDRLQAAGVADAMLDLGGNLAAMGGCGGRPWRIGVRDPHGEGLVASLATQGREAVVTSGSYERFRMADGERITHILDPQRAAPVAGLASVTVLHRCAALADAAATALLVAGPQRWPRVAERLGVSQVLVIDRFGCCTASAALAPRLAFEPGTGRRLVVV
jgi:thiamine biosynthesis lipoprotein